MFANACFLILPYKLDSKEIDDSSLDKNNHYALQKIQAIYLMGSKLMIIG